MSNKRLLGLVLNKGGETSHTAILARTLGIPAILDTGNATELIASGDTLAVDSIGGEVIVQPSADAALEIGRKIEQFGQYKEQLKILSQVPELTRDRHQFHAAVSFSRNLMAADFEFFHKFFLFYAAHLSLG